LDSKFIWERKRLSLKELKIPILALLAIVFTLALEATEITLYGIFEGILRGYFPDIYWNPERVQTVTNSV